MFAQMLLLPAIAVMSVAAGKSFNILSLASPAIHMMQLGLRSMACAGLREDDANPTLL